MIHFTFSYDLLYFSLERKCKILGKSSRLRVYDYLSFFCKVRKETLMRRAKNLVLEDEEIRLKKSTNKLKDCVASVMPELIANFEMEGQQVLAKKLIIQTSSSSLILTFFFCRFSTEGHSDENKTLKLPRRRFPWSDETK